MVMMYIRFPLSPRNIEHPLHERGIGVRYESLRLWVDRFGSFFVRMIRMRRSPAMRQVIQWRRHSDEVSLKIAGETHYLCRTFDHQGEALDAYVIKMRVKATALRFPRIGRYLNNQVENSHLPFRRR